MTAAPAPDRQARAFVPAIVAVAVALLFLSFMFMATEGHFVPQVVDLYLTCQYAKAIADGHPFRYNPGEAFSTGATSLLHTSILGLAHAIGFRGEGLVAFAIVSGVAGFIASVVLACRTGSILAGPRGGLLAGILVALGGPVVWGFLYGSDVSLFMLLATALLGRLVSEWNGRSVRGGVIVASLLALTRPEGLPIGLFLGMAWTLGSQKTRRGLGRLVPWIPAGMGTCIVILNRGLTGFWVSTSVVDKSLFANYGLLDGLALVSEYGIDVLRGLLLGLYPSQAPVGISQGSSSLFFPPLGLAFVLLALVRARQDMVVPLRLWGGMVALVFALVAPNIFMGAHFNRYLLWAFPGLLVLASVGLSEATRLLARDDTAIERRLFGAGAGLAVGLGFLSTLRMAATYGEFAGEVYRRDLAAAHWIANNLPRGVPMANLVTSVEYLTGHRNLNLHGVTSPAFFGNRTAEREAGVYEAFVRLPESERPPYLITSVSSQDAYPSMRHLVAGQPLFQTTSFGDEILIYRMRYDLVGSNVRIVVPAVQERVRALQQVDRINVCDTRDEQLHGYRFRSAFGGLRLHGTVQVASYGAVGAGRTVMDAGRPIFGSETFSVRGTKQSKDLIVVLRTSGSVNARLLRAGGSGVVSMGFPDAEIIAHVNGQVCARLPFRSEAGWDEQVLRVPASCIEEGATVLTLSGRYASFYYWFFQ